MKVQGSEISYQQDETTSPETDLQADESGLIINWEETKGNIIACISQIKERQIN